jgi:hypothetical protein
MVARAVSAASPVIDATVAGLYVGQPVVLEGVVTSTAREGNVVHLRVGAPPQSVTVTLIEGLLSNFPPAAEQFYAGKRVRVGGIVQQFRGTLEIRLLNVSGIQIYEPGQAVPAAAASGVAPLTAPVAPPPAAGADAQRLQALEERIRQLESAPTAAATATPDLAPTQTSVPSPTHTTVPSPTLAQSVPEVLPSPTSTPAPAIVAPPVVAPVHEAEAATLEGILERLKKVEIRVRHLERALEDRR